MGRFEKVYMPCSEAQVRILPSGTILQADALTTEHPDPLLTALNLAELYTESRTELLCEGNGYVNLTKFDNLGINI